jgi:hypothetical protein
LPEEARVSQTWKEKARAARGKARDTNSSNDTYTERVSSAHAKYPGSGRQASSKWQAAVRGAGSNRSGIESSEGGSWVDQLAKVRDGDLVYLIRGKDAGRPAWHYVHIDGMKLRAFKRALATGSLDVSQYGEILKSGWGKDPPGDIVKWVKDRYG